MQVDAARKMLGVIVSYIGIKVIKEKIEQAQLQNSEKFEKDIIVRLTNERCVENYRRMFDQRFRREK